MNCKSKNLEENVYEITKNDFSQLIRVDWSDETISYYNSNNGEWAENLHQSCWSFQEATIQKEYELFLNEISTDDQLLEFIAGLELGDDIMTLSGHNVTII